MEFPCSSGRKEVRIRKDSGKRKEYITRTVEAGVLSCEADHEKSKPSGVRGRGPQ